MQGLATAATASPRTFKPSSASQRGVGAEFPLLREVARINDQAVESAVDKVLEALWNVEGKKIALLGLSFKPGTDDVRSAPALSLARLLLREGVHVVGYDPQGGANAKACFPKPRFAMHDDAVNDAHCMVLCTEWEEFKTLDLDKLHSLMAYPVVIDGRNLFDPQEMRNAGFSYYPTGRPHVV